MSVSDELDFVPSAIDALSSIQPIPTKKTLMLVNNFIVNTVDFINKFSALCERKLAKISLHTQKLETQLLLLETKLESVPWTDETPQMEPTQTTTIASSQPTEQSAPRGSPPPPEAAEASLQQASAPVSAPVSAPAAPVVSAPVAAPPAPAFTGPKLKDDPRFEKYFRMLRAGLPKQVVRFKIQADSQGEIDPDIIDCDPEGPAPPMSEALAKAVVPAADSGDESD